MVTRYVKSGVVMSEWGSHGHPQVRLNTSWGISILYWIFLEAYPILQKGRKYFLVQTNFNTLFKRTKTQ